MHPPILLDDLEILERIGAGGMGAVWRARHVPSGEVVAVKTLPVFGGASAVVRRALEDEIRSVASLDHPHIVAVYDRGRVDAHAAAASGGLLQPGSPYLVMEYVSGGTLTDLRALTWPRVRGLLLQVLDALAHAHARGILHRDVKPPNILLDPDTGAARLTDFGLARSAAGPGLRSAAVGTPEFMAPELVTGATLEQGPPSDLYGLACVAWALLCGAPPFTGAPERVLDAQVGAPLPTFAPRVDVPSSVEVWLRRCLAKEPTDRYALAADAADALRAIDAIPPPADWRRPPDPRPALHLRGAGLALYGVRSIPMVGRDDERDALWSSLHRVRDGHPRGVVLRGPAGVGKSRLARWLCERSEELGAARSLHATHGDQPGPHDGLGPMLLDLLGLDGPPRSVVRQALERLLPEAPDTVAALTEIARPTTAAELAAGARPTRFARSEERYLAIEALLVRLGRDRPVVVWLDDAHLGIDSLAFASFLLRARRVADLPVLVLLTVRDEDLPERALEGALLSGLLAMPACDQLGVTALDASEHPALVRGLLGLDGPLADRVEERTAGNPLFAVHLVGDWVQRGVLEAGGGGLRLRAGVDVSLPSDLRAVWSRPVEALLGGRAPADRLALELGAALGHAVDAGEWLGVCRSVGIEPSDDLLAAAAGRSLVLPEADQWTWAHGMVREAILASADAPARHTACAEYLAPLLDTFDQNRLGAHWMSAGRPDRAFHPFLESSVRQDNRGDQARARRSMERARDALDVLDVSPTDPRALKMRYQLALFQTSSGDLSQAITLLQALVPDVAAAGAHALQVSVLHSMARAQANNGQGDVALRTAEEALALYETAGIDEPRRLARALGTAAIAAARSAGPEVELAYARRAREIAMEYGSDAYLVASSGTTLATALLHNEDYEGARPVLDATIAHAREWGFVAAEVRALNLMGEIARFQGDYAAAEGFLLRAVALSEARRPVGNVLVRTNLALLALERGDPLTATAKAKHARELAVAQGNRAFTFYANLIALSGAAVAEDWEEWDASWVAVAPLLSDPFRDPEMAMILRWAGEYAAASPQRAAKARAAELRYWERFGTEEEKEEARARLSLEEPTEPHASP